MENKKAPYVFYWIIIGIGILSFTVPIFREYGIITTLILTFLCGISSWAIAIVISKRSFMYISGLLLISPWVFLLAKHFIN